LGYTKVLSLIDGIAGINTVQVGNLVGPSTVLTAVSQVSPIKVTEDGENVLLELMKEGASFRSSGVFTKHVLKRLACKIRRDVS
jgi:multidrug efflux pump subunit AcrA (membrane-fusion protein)